MGSKVSKPADHFSDSMSSQITQVEKLNVLVSGYVKSNFEKTIPDDIIKLFESFFDKGICWIISVDELINSDENNKLIAPKFAVRAKGLIFEFIVINNDVSSFLPNCIGIEMHKHKTKDLVIQTMIHLSIDELNTCWKRYKVLESHLIQSDTINNVYKRIQLPFNIAKCTNYKQLTFRVNMEILSIRSFNNLIHNEKLLTSLTLSNQTMQFEWKINEKLLNQFKTAHNGQVFCSDNFGKDNNFALLCIPEYTNNNTFYPRSTDQVVAESYIIFQCLAIPNNIQYFLVNICIELKSHDNKINLKKQWMDIDLTFNNDYPDYDRWKKLRGLRKAIKESNSPFSFILTIETRPIYD